MPVAAQAAGPHYYVNGVELKKSKPIDTVSWGTLTLKSALGTTTCHNIDFAEIENPDNGGPGVSKILGFVPQESTCVAPGCPGVIEVVPLAKTATGDQELGTNLPSPTFWPDVLKEVEPGVERDVTGTAENPIIINIKCFVPPEDGGEVLNVDFSGINEPLTVNGGSAAKPSTQNFDPEGSSGHLESEDGPGITLGEDTVMGYAEEEVITNK